MDEYTLIFLFSHCIRCAQKRDCWESVRFASERSSNQPGGLLLRARVPTSRNIYRGDFRSCRIVLYDAAFFMSKNLWQTVPGSEL